MRVIWHGTASVEIVSEGGRLLFDPFVPIKGSEVPVKIGDFDGFTDIFITHGHLDHITDVPRIVEREPGCVVRCTRTPYATLRRKGVPERNLSLIDCGDEIEVNGFRVRAYHGKHAVLPKIGAKRLAYMLGSPARRNIPGLLRKHLACPERDETVFYTVGAEGKTVEVMGSLNLREEVDYPVGADLLVLPYNGWEDNLSPAVRAMERLKPKRAVLDHYDDSFPPLTMPLDLTPFLERYKDSAEPMELGRSIEV